MNKKIVRLMLSLLVGLTSTTWSRAQETAAPARKQALPKEVLDAKAKAREKRVQARAKADAEAKAKAIDVNHASREELKTLPGITDAYADAIIAKRPYKTKAELATKNAIPKGTFQSIRKLVAAK